MINLNTQLQKVMASQNLEGLRPFAYLYSNKWNSTSNKYELENTAIDISSMIVKPNTLSMTLDVNEIAQFNANNITLTLTDYENKFIEGTPNSFFPSGYQLYGSKVILYYGTNISDMVSLFVGVIKDLPTHKPEQYQVDLKLISPLELLNDIEAKDFSNKYTGEALTFVKIDDDGHYVYQTTGVGVGGFSAVYGNSTKLFEGVDYEVSQINSLGLPALITIIRADYYSATITADYYCWKTGLSIEEIVSGLVALGGYTTNTDIRNVIWNTAVRNIMSFNADFTIGFYKQNNNFIFNWFNNVSSWEAFNLRNDYVVRQSIFPSEFTINANMRYTKVSASAGTARYSLGDDFYSDTYGNKVVYNGYSIGMYDNGAGSQFHITLATFNQGQIASSRELYSGAYREIKGVQVKNNKVYFFDTNGIALCEENLFFNPKTEVYTSINPNNSVRLEITNLKFSPNVDNYIISNNAEQYSTPVIKSNVLDKNGTAGYWGGLIASLDGQPPINYALKYAVSNNGISFSNLESIDINTEIGVSERYLYFIFQIISLTPTNLINPQFSYYQNYLTLNMVNLGNSSVLEALQDLALISGYEFGVDRQGTFFFRPRSQSTTPIFELDETQIVKIDNIKQNFNDFFTKLTLTFAEIPLEFYANTGTRPTLVDKYGIINKEINKPDIVNYDNPELAQAIGPQLLEIYSNLSNQIQCTAKLNLSLELGDIVNVKRNYNLNTPDAASDYEKFINQNTYYRACKITGINYNLAKKQMTYTLRDVSNSNTEPQQETPQFVYTLPIEL